MGIFDITPSIRLDTEAFNKALDALGMSKTQFNRKLKRLGVDPSDQRSKTNYLNKLLKDAGKPELQYQNVVSSKPSKRLTTKGKVEVGMGGQDPEPLAHQPMQKYGVMVQRYKKQQLKNFPIV